MSANVTKGQQEILNLLNNGWELGVSDFMGEQRVSIQYGGIGKGGESRKIRKSVFDALLAANLIVRTRQKYPTVMYAAASA